MRKIQVLVNRRRVDNSFIMMLFGLLVVAAVTTTTTTTLFVQADGRILKQLHVVTRHGSRLELPKSSTTLAEHALPALTPFGEKLCYDVGVWLRQRYGTVNSNGETTDFFENYDPNRIHLESSSFDRTIVSANSIALGLFPTRESRDLLGDSLLPGNTTLPANIPVYTVAVEDDVTIRAYDKCADGLQLEALYQSEEWKMLESQNYNLLSVVAEYPEFADYVVTYVGVGNAGIQDKKYIPLEQLWNVFDMISVAKTECYAASTAMNVSSTYTLSDFPACNTKLADWLSEIEWRQLVSVVHETEQMKYGSTTAGPLVGGNLLATILMRMAVDDSLDIAVDDTEDSNSSSTIFNLRQFYLYSAHYPTILGLLATLGEELTGAAKGIPGYAAALIFELYEDSVTNEYTVDVLYKPGGGAVSEAGIYFKLTLSKACPPSESSSSSSSPCPLDTFADRLGDLGISEWCDQCGNTDSKACMSVAISRSGSGSGSSSSPSTQTAAPVCRNDGLVIAILVSFVLGMLSCFAVVQVIRNNSSSSNNNNNDIKENNNDNNNNNNESPTGSSSGSGGSPDNVVVVQKEDLDKSDTLSVASIL